VGICALLLSACQHSTQSVPQAITTTSPTPLPTVSLLETFTSSLVTISPSPFRPSPPPSIRPIPPSHADQVVISEVMQMLPPRLHSQVHWFHISPGKVGYNHLPNHGLVVTLGPQYVLYFDGAVQPHSNLIYDPNLDPYLVIVPHDWQYFMCSPTGQVGLTCARPVH